MLGDVYDKPYLVFGCGNTLLGDDGFGPAVIGHLKRHCQLPPQALALDVGTASREYLFDLLLSPQKPRKLLVLDAVDLPGLAPGQLLELDLEGLPAAKTHDFSLHQFPSLNLLQELRDLAGVEVRVLVAKVARPPQEVAPGLSPALLQALPAACAWVLAQLPRPHETDCPRLSPGVFPHTNASEGYPQ